MDEYLEFVKKSALEAGEIMKQHFMTNMVIEYKDDQSRVTAADKAINHKFIESVEAAFPGHHVLGEEESTYTVGDKEVWVCDPIDGTFWFSVGMPLGLFAVAFVRDGEPLVAVAYEPISNKMYTAVKGRGSFLNDQPIHVSKNLLPSKDANSFDKGVRIDINDRSDKELGSFREVGNELHEKGVKIIGLRSSVVVGTLVAQGVLSAGLAMTRYPHDIAAIKLIVEEAGGKVTDISGKEQRYDSQIRGAIISNGLIHDELVDIVRNRT